MSDGGQSGDVGADRPGDRLSLGIAQYGELPGHVCDGAVVLADLDGGPAEGGVGDGGGVAVVTMASAKQFGLA